MKGRPTVLLGHDNGDNNEDDKISSKKNYSVDLQLALATIKMDQIRIKKSAVVTILNDLQRLHLDTQRLMHNITSSVILETFSNPDCFAVVSAMEQIQAHHDNTIEKLMDIILNLRQLAKLEEKETMTSC